MPAADNDSGAPSEHKLPDQHGAAALSFVESLIHWMVGRSALTHVEALEIIQIAADAQGEIIHERGNSPSNGPDAATLLSAIHASLAIDSR